MMFPCYYVSLREILCVEQDVFDMDGSKVAGAAFFFSCPPYVIDSELFIAPAIENVLFFK